MSKPGFLKAAEYLEDFFLLINNSVCLVVITINFGSYIGHCKVMQGNILFYEVIVFKAHFLAYTSRYAKSST